MKNLIELVMDDNSKLLIETVDCLPLNDDPLMLPASSNQKKIIRKTKGFIDDCIVQINNYSKILTTAISELNICPNEFELEFSIKFSADAGIIISSVNSEANMTIKMKWSQNNE